MNKFRTKRFIRQKNESVNDPRELLLSLVDMGSIDSDEMLLACVSEMSDAECKRVLNTLSLPSCCDEVDDEMSVEVDEPTIEFPSDEDESGETADTEEVDLADEDEEDEDAIELEARIRRLERCLRTESMNCNRVRRFPRRTNR